jgi:hypothetical protein
MAVTDKSLRPALMIGGDAGGSSAAPSGAGASPRTDILGPPIAFRM